MTSTRIPQRLEWIHARVFYAMKCLKQQPFIDGVMSYVAADWREQHKDAWFSCVLVEVCVKAARHRRTINLHNLHLIADHPPFGRVHRLCYCLRQNHSSLHLTSTSPLWADTSVRCAITAGGRYVVLPGLACPTDQPHASFNCLWPTREDTERILSDTVPQTAGLKRKKASSSSQQLHNALRISPPKRRRRWCISSPRDDEEPPL